MTGFFHTSLQCKTNKYIDGSLGGFAIFSSKRLGYHCHVIYMYMSRIRRDLIHHGIVINYTIIVLSIYSAVLLELVQKIMRFWCYIFLDGVNRTTAKILNIRLVRFLDTVAWSLFVRGQRG